MFTSILRGWIFYSSKLICIDNVFYFHIYERGKGKFVKIYKKKRKQNV